MTHGWNRKTGTVADSMTAAGKQVSCKKSYANLVAPAQGTVRPVKELPAVGMTVSRRRDDRVDTGQNLAGVLRVKTKLPANKNGIRSFLKLWINMETISTIFSCQRKQEPQASDIYGSNSTEFTEYTSHFTYHGFRYQQSDMRSAGRQMISQRLSLCSDNEDLRNF